MEKKTFKTMINARPEKVWKTLWDNSSYNKWASAFGENQEVKTDWKEGSRIEFLDLNGDGMLSEVVENKSAERLSLQHIGIVNKGVPDLESKHAKEWAGAKETYILKPLDNSTELVIETDLADEWKDYFNERWPQALEKIKQLSEA
jgi:hypothetical protein